MKRLMVLSLVACVSVCAFPQTDSGASAPSKNVTKTLQGCLSSSNGEYTLTDSSGNAIWLRGKDTASLQNSVGHQIQVTGIEREVTERSSTGVRTSQNDAIASRSDPDQNSFLVQSVQDTGSPCSSAGTQR